MNYLKNRTYPGPVMNGMLVWMGENQAEGADAAIEFLKTKRMCGVNGFQDQC
jgi:glycine betaine/proline transport system substrate-binding protein